MESIPTVESSGAEIHNWIDQGEDTEGSHIRLERDAGILGIAVVAYRNCLRRT